VPIPFVGRFAAFLTAALLCSTVIAADDIPSRAAIERQFRQGQPAQALQWAERAVAAVPDDAAMRFLYGVMLSESRREQDAIRIFERMLLDFPELPEPYNNLAVLRAAQGELDRSRELLEAALRSDPGYRTAHQNLGDIFVRLALRAYEAAGQGNRADEPLQRRLRMTRDLVGIGAKP
jgi:Flp pilus assembly protein TadD